MAVRGRPRPHSGAERAEPRRRPRSPTLRAVSRTARSRGPRFGSRSYFHAPSAQARMLASSETRRRLPEELDAERKASRVPALPNRLCGHNHHWQARRRSHGRFPTRIREPAQRRRVVTSCRVAQYISGGSRCAHRMGFVQPVETEGFPCTHLERVDARWVAILSWARTTASRLPSSHSRRGS